jgi:prephenate dehydrogenase
MRPDTLGVIGLGAIGGSVAWQAAQSGVPRVIGYSPLPAEAVAALRAGAITEVADRPERVVQAADLVVVAAPPGATLGLLRELRDQLLRRAVLCTDVSSVKHPVVALVARLGLGSVFAGSHPLAGSHESGFAAAKPSLFENVLVYVTPLADGERAGQEIADFWATVCRAAPVYWDAGDHDRVLAWTSHLPQAVASALAAALGRLGPKAVTYGPGARDTTRLAASNPAMWHDILLLNRDAVLAALDGVEEELGRLRQALATGDGPGLTAWLEQARDWRRRLDP